MKETINTFEAASRYVASGYRVVPIKPLQKRPPMNSWGTVATTDPATVTAWWAPGGTYEDHGIGLALGWQETPYGSRCVFAVDLDEHKPDQSGAKAWAALITEHGDPGETVMAATAGGGVHLLFAAESHVRNGKIAPGVDIRGQGGQIAVYPTIHPVLACQSCKDEVPHDLLDYTWIEGRAPWEHELLDAPDWLLELVEDAPEPEHDSRVSAVLEEQKAQGRQRLSRLTDREHEVFDGLVLGKSNKGIAHDLGISPRTIEIHRARVMEKLEARTLSDIVRLALALGLRQEPGP